MTSRRPPSLDDDDDDDDDDDRSSVRGRRTPARVRSVSQSLTQSFRRARLVGTRERTFLDGFGLVWIRDDALYDEDDDGDDDDDDHDWSVCFDDDDVDTGVRGRHG